MNYVEGFLFSYDMTKFVLIKKNRGPSHMIGKLAGVGGKIGESRREVGDEREFIKLNESPLHAMSREFEEETGLLVKQNRWHCFLIKQFQRFCFTRSPVSSSNSRDIA